MSKKLRDQLRDQQLETDGKFRNFHQHLTHLRKLVEESEAQQVMKTVMQLRAEVDLKFDELSRRESNNAEHINRVERDTSRLVAALHEMREQVQLILKLITRRAKKVEKKRARKK